MGRCQKVTWIYKMTAYPYGRSEKSRKPLQNGDRGLCQSKHKVSLKVPVGTSMTNRWMITIPDWKITSFVCNDLEPWVFHSISGRGEVCEKNYQSRGHFCLYFLIPRTEIHKCILSTKHATTYIYICSNCLHVAFTEYWLNKAHIFYKGFQS